MSKQLFYLSFFLYFGFLSCNSSKVITGEVNYLNATEAGTLLVSAAGYGQSKPDAIANAQTNAFNNLIFRGIPGSQYQLPMVQDESKARKEHGKYFSNLLEQGGYKPFMMLSEEQTGYSVSRKGQKNITVMVKINVDALRRDMEQKGVVRKFGL
ncbi:MAG: hypothetical protein IPN76_21185 [Saprospiraceae bacterium]|nr:hypothetical protein [Saprospiraceae bacterium]